MSLASIKDEYDAQGYVIIPGLVTPALFPLLVAASERVTNLTRSGSWPHRRTVGKQFPPYGEDDPDSWGVQHLMHPGLGERVFAEWYTSDGLVGAVKVLMSLCRPQDVEGQPGETVGEQLEAVGRSPGGEEFLQMELFNLLINPLNHDFALRWHRDDIKEEATEEEEKEALGRWQFGVQWNTALYVDSCLYIVPGSHKTARTPEQRKISLESGGKALDDPLQMPGSIQVTIQPGETVFYNSNILHCAAYKSTEKRATLHGCMGSTKGGSVRARNILQHGLEWMKSNEFKGTLPNKRAERMLAKLVAMHAANGKADVGFSLQG